MRTKITAGHLHQVLPGLPFLFRGAGFAVRFTGGLVDLEIATGQI